MYRDLDLMEKTAEMILLGEAHWLKQPTLARHHSNHLHELFYDTRFLVRNRELINLRQPEEFWKGQKETLPVQPPPRILLSGIHLGWTRHAPPGRTQSEWVAKDNQETNPINIKSKTASHFVRGSTLKPPTLARHHSNHLHELFYDKRSW